MKCEYFLPSVVSNLLAEGRATVKYLNQKINGMELHTKRTSRFSCSGTGFERRRSLSTEIGD